MCMCVLCPRQVDKEVYDCIMDERSVCGALKYALLCEGDHEEMFGKALGQLEVRTEREGGKDLLV